MRDHFGAAPLVATSTTRCHDSLRRLQTDYIDLYQVHFPDLKTPIEETMRALDDLVRGGEVRYIGCSNFRAWRIVEAQWVCEERSSFSIHLGPESLQPSGA